MSGRAYPFEMKSTVFTFGYLSNWHQPYENPSMRIPIDYLALYKWGGVKPVETDWLVFEIRMSFSVGWLLWDSADFLNYVVLWFLEHLLGFLFSLCFLSSLHSLLCKFLELAVLSLNVVLREVAVLAHASRVVGSVEVAASISHLALAFSVVAVVAHVLRVVLLVCVRAQQYLSSLSFALLSCNLHFFRQAFRVRLSWWRRCLVILNFFRAFRENRFLFWFDCLLSNFIYVIEFDTGIFAIH